MFECSSILRHPWVNDFQQCSALLTIHNHDNHDNVIDDWCSFRLSGSKETRLKMFYVKNEVFLEVATSWVLRLFLICYFEHN